MAEETTTESDTSQKNLQFLVGEKKGMTQVFDEAGNVHPATVVEAGPVTVVQVKTVEQDGYSAYQLGYGTRSKKNVNKAQQGHTKAARENADREEHFQVLREYRLEEEGELSVGDVIDVSSFSRGDKVNVSGYSKGKGFQGVTKRHNFSGGPRTHGGQKHSERAVGSIGATGPSHVFKGQKMPGRAGGRKATVENLEVVHVDKEDNELYIRGGLPGPSGSLLEIVGLDNKDS